MGAGRACKKGESRPVPCGPKLLLARRAARSLLLRARSKRAAPQQKLGPPAPLPQGPRHLPVVTEFCSPGMRPLMPSRVRAACPLRYDESMVAADSLYAV